MTQNGKDDNPYITWPSAMRACLRDTGLPIGASHCGLILSTYANRDGRSFPSLNTLAADMRCSKSSVQRRLKLLLAEGVIVASGSQHRRRVYLLQCGHNADHVEGVKVVNRPGTVDGSVVTQAGNVGISGTDAGTKVVNQDAKVVKTGVEGGHSGDYQRKRKIEERGAREADQPLEAPARALINPDREAEVAEVLAKHGIDSE